MIRGIVTPDVVTLDEQHKDLPKCYSEYTNDAKDQWL